MPLLSYNWYSRIVKNLLKMIKYYHHLLKINYFHLFYKRNCHNYCSNKQKVYQYKVTYRNCKRTSNIFKRPIPQNNHKRYYKCSISIMPANS
jgi:hypothetical protein